MNSVSSRPQIVRHDRNSRRSRAVMVGDIIYFAGQIGDDLSGDVAQQTREALARLDRLLAELGSDKSRLVSATIWLRDMADFEAMNAVWDGWIDPANPPARSCAQVVMAEPSIRVEIIPVAAR